MLSTSRYMLFYVMHQNGCQPIHLSNNVVLMTLVTRRVHERSQRSKNNFHRNRCKLSLSM